MREEFHWDNGYQQLYGWSTLYDNVWLPSLSELVGIDTKNYHEGRGTYFSAMQGLNTSTDWFADAQGGEQFAYFKLYNASGGGEAIMNTCNQQMSWLRSPCCWDMINAWIITNATRGDVPACTGSAAVHPAVSIQVPYPSDWFSLQK